MFDTNYGTIDLDDFEYFIENVKGGFCASADFGNAEIEGNIEATPALALESAVNFVRVQLGFDWELDAPIPDNLVVNGVKLS